jgi:hypothetical protein
VALRDMGVAIPSDPNTKADLFALNSARETKQIDSNHTIHVPSPQFPVPTVSSQACGDTGLE